MTLSLLACFDWNRFVFLGSMTVIKLGIDPVTVNPGR